MAEPQDTPARRFFRALLVGAVESVARGITKGMESIADDAGKVVAREKKKIADWRREQLGEIEMPMGADADGDEASAASRKVQ